MNSSRHAQGKRVNWHKLNVFFLKDDKSCVVILLEGEKTKGSYYYSWSISGLQEEGGFLNFVALQG
jgi:hypothetical protein